MTNAIIAKNLFKTYENGTKALIDFNLSVKQGDFFALLGPNVEIAPIFTTPLVEYI